MSSKQSIPSFPPCPRGNWFDLKGTRDDVKNAMGMTGSDQWVDRLPQKWETVFDGENLSGGEIQKVMAARALMKKRSVIFMDEPMASLDRKAAQFFAVELFRAGYVWNFKGDFLGG